MKLVADGQTGPLNRRLLPAGVVPTQHLTLLSKGANVRKQSFHTRRPGAAGANPSDSGLSATPGRPHLPMLVRQR